MASLPIPASGRSSAVPRRSRRPYLVAMGAVLCLAAVGTVVVTDGGANMLATGIAPEAEQQSAHLQRREDLVANMLDKLNNLGIKPSSPAPTGPSTFSRFHVSQTEQPTQTDDGSQAAPVPTDQNGEEIPYIPTREQVMADNGWTEAELDARLDPNNPLYDPILDSELNAPPPLPGAFNTTTTPAATKTSTTSITHTSAKPTAAPAKETSAKPTPKPTSSAKPSPSS